MPPPLLKLPRNPVNCIVRGDTWYGVAFTMTKDANPLVLTGCSVKITFRSPSESWTISTGDGITITNGAAGQMQIDKIQSLQHAPGIYKGDLQITFPSGDITTYVQIELTITDDITK